MLYLTIISTFASGIAALAVYIYYLRKGQFENIEEIKYQIFREDDSIKK